MQIEFDWDALKAASNLAKHGVSFEQALGVFVDPLAVSVLDEGHGKAEERWVTLGQAVTELLVVVHTWREEPGQVEVRIISVRRPTRSERRVYQEGPDA